VGSWFAYLFVVERRADYVGVGSSANPPRTLPASVGQLWVAIAPTANFNAALRNSQQPVTRASGWRAPAVFAHGHVPIKARVKLFDHVQLGLIAYFAFALEVAVEGALATLRRGSAALRSARLSAVEDALCRRIVSERLKLRSLF
jgi:hypothetical protein